MAVDTRDKRASATCVLAPWRLVLPSPGTIDQGDRQQLAWAYRGILSGSVTTAAPPADPFTATAAAAYTPFTATASQFAAFTATVAATIDPFAATAALRTS